MPKTRITQKQPVQPQPSTFISEAAAKFYEQCISKRQLLCERGFQFDSSDTRYSAMVMPTITQHNWHHFCQHPKLVIVPVVREFCANMAAPRSVRMPVRGVSVDVSPRAINDFYQLPEVDNEYEWLVNQPHEDYLNQVLHRLCISGTTWSISPQGAYTFPRNCLRRDAKVWYHFLQTRLLPTSHIQTVSRDRAILLHCVLEGRRINVGRIIHSELFLCASQDKGKICFPALIYGLCANSGVPCNEREERIEVGGAITSSTICRLLKSKGASLHFEEDDEADYDAADHEVDYDAVDDGHPAAPYPGSPYAGATSGSQDATALLQQRMEQLEMNQQAMMKQWRKVWRYNQARDSALAQNLKTKAKNFAPFPEFPSEVLHSPPGSPTAD